MEALSTLARRLLDVDSALTRAEVSHAFGGAIALGYALVEPRTTRDLDINLFVPSSDAERVLRALPEAVSWTSDDLDAIARDDQVRVWWDTTPLDLFFAAAPFHLEVGRRTLTVVFADRSIEVLAPSDLATFKVLFNRTKDWRDLETMAESGSLDHQRVARQLTDLLGDDPRIARLRGVRGD